MAVTEPDDTIDREQLASGISWLLAGIALLVLDVRLASVEVDADGLAQLDLLFDPAGAAVLATVTVATTAIGVVLLARHLRQALTGVAADRWRQVTIAWAVTLAVLPLVLLTGALELVFVVLAAVAIAGVLLLVALFATRRAAEENELDRRFEG